MNVTRDLAVGGGAFAASLLVTPLASRFARRVGLMDRPGPLKPHASAIPYLGGIGVAAGTAIGAVFFHPWLLLPFAIALNLGIADDAQPMSPMTRLIGQLATGLVLASVVQTRFPGVVSFVLVTLAAVTLMNAYNLLDGLDALCGSITLVSAAGFAVVLSGDARLLALALAGATAGFLVFNFPPASVYLGDGGTYLIGAVMAALLAATWGPGVRLSVGVAGIALVAVPVLELCLAVLRRVRSRHSVLEGDRNHPYDQLVRRGWSKGLAVASYTVAGIVVVGAAVVAGRLLSTPLALLTAGGIVVVVAFVGLAGFTTAQDSRRTGGGAR